MTAVKSRATLEDLYRVPDHGKAELVNGELVFMAPTGDAPGYAGDEIFVALREYARRTRTGRAVSDNKGFYVNLPHRESFSPNAAFYVGPSAGMKFFQGAHVFAAEVRSENDYGRQAESAIRAKRADYFDAGTLVVWEVDLLLEEVIKVYRISAPDNPTVYQRGEVAEAEPAIPGWTMPVDNLFV